MTSGRGETPGRGARRVIVPSEVPVLPGSSAAVAAGGLVFTGSMLPMDADHRLHPAAVVDSDAVPGSDPLELQSEVLLGHLRETLAAAGCNVGTDVVRIYQWAPARYDANLDVLSDGAWPRFHPADGYVRAASRVLDGVRTSTGIGVRQLPVADALFAVEVVAVQPQPGVVKQGYAEGDSERVLPFVSTVGAGDWVTLSAGPSDFKGDWMSSVSMGEPSFLAPQARPNPYIWLGSEIEAQTEYTLQRLARAAESAGTSLDRCVHADVTLAHASDFAGFERVWRRWFPHRPPARNLATGARLVIKGGRVEVGATCLTRDAKIEPVRIEATLPPHGHAPDGVRAGELLFISTRMPIDASGRVPPRMRPDPARSWFNRAPARDQVRQVLDELAVVCAAAGTSLRHVCKVQAFLSDLEHLPEFLDCWRDAFPERPPALAVMGMGGAPALLAPHAIVMAGAIAWVPATNSDHD